MFSLIDVLWHDACKSEGPINDLKFAIRALRKSPGFAARSAGVLPVLGVPGS
jgi:hypothetical protein